MATSERWTWEEQCDTLLCEAIAALGRYNGSLDSKLWRPHATRGPLTVSRHVGDAANAASSTRLAGTGYLHGRLEDITRGLYCDTHEDLVGNEAVLTGEPVLDGAVLQTLEKRGAETPFRFAGVKWVATQCGSLQRDLLTFERMGMTLDSDNTEVAYHIVYAIPDHADWPTPTQLRTVSHLYRERTAPQGIQRLEPFALCYLYRKVSDDLVLCFILGEYWGQATASVQRESEHVLTQRVLMISNALLCCEAKILTKMLDHCRDAPVQQSKTCLRCRVTRGTATSPLRICGICRKSVCRACYSLKTTSRLNATTKVAESVPFCVRCLIRADIPTACSGEPRRGLRNAEHDLIDRRQRRELQHYNNQQDRQRDRHDRRHAASQLHARHHREPRGRVQLDSQSFIAAHAYNYDGLIRNRGSTMQPFKTAGDEGRASDGSVGMRVTDASVHADSRRSRDDLYLRGSFMNMASTEAERRYQRHLVREKSLRVEDLEDSRPPPSRDARPRRQMPIPVPPSSSSRVHGERTDLATDRRQTLAVPNLNSPETVRNQSTVREFYRDLYSEL